MSAEYFARIKKALGENIPRLNIKSFPFLISMFALLGLAVPTHVSADTTEPPPIRKCDPNDYKNTRNVMFSKIATAVYFRIENGVLIMDNRPGTKPGDPGYVYDQNPITPGVEGTDPVVGHHPICKGSSTPFFTDSLQRKNGNPNSKGYRGNRGTIFHRE